MQQTEINIDFLSPKQRQRRKDALANKDLLAKAVGLKNARKTDWHIIDATAGFGNDAYLMASLGAKVTMLERSPLIVELLQNALKRAQGEIEKHKINLELIHCDAKNYFEKILSNKIKKRPEVIYLDPMYPKRKKSALNKKELRILAELVGKDEDANQLLPLALKIATKRVVVKRPKLAKPLANLKPSLVMRGSSIRFDIYLCKSSETGEPILD